MIKTLYLFPALILSIGCAPSAPSKVEYKSAIEDFWPTAQAKWAEKAEFFDSHAESFRRGAELRRSVSASLGRQDDGASTDETANESADAARFSRWLSTAAVEDVENIRCVPAANLPGQNCEMEVLIKGLDGKDDKISGAWRFDKLDGKLAIVGYVQN
ncbi:hypothetical protein [Parasphingorhabdus cellanae]|uniref:Lipoprotein n=1 Tax=Parasphingorhabdus cellanae TaxID=2806553 RepID=A0ABX7T6P4_9SPHN|nr:hypothetical protein [Parasphingorhabdus cellanae]QTD57265.1 hypothetical protein J4G78_06945 [Parasphingorhabdus cellanae]